MNLKLLLTVSLGFLVMAPVATATALQPVRLTNDHTNTNATANKNSAAQFCSRLATIKTETVQRLTSRHGNVTTHQATRETNLVERKDKRDDRLGNHRQTWDDNRDEHYAKLRVRATTESQKQAVETFISTVDTAVTKRRTAVDAAILAFRASVESTIDARQTALDDAMTAYQAATDAAFATATQACTDGTADATVRTTLHDALTTTRTTFTAARQATEKVGPQVSDLTATRRAVIDAAFATFKTEVQTARDVLKAAFGQTNNSPQP